MMFQDISKRVVGNILILFFSFKYIPGHALAWPSLFESYGPFLPQ